MNRYEVEFLNDMTRGFADEDGFKDTYSAYDLFCLLYDC